MTAPESIVVRWQPFHGPARRNVFEPAVDGWYLVDEVWGGDGGWRERGRELVEEVGFEGVPADAVDG